jgi:hypothetical protein
VAQNLTYSYLVAWIVGGLMLLIMLLLRTRRRPLWLSFGLIGFGAAGFLALGLGVGAWNLTLVYALVTAALGAAVGYGVMRIGAS